MDFNFKQNPVEPDYIEPIKAEVLELGFSNLLGGEGVLSGKREREKQNKAREED